jgi:anti-sigma B factor antagonist
MIRIEAIHGIFLELIDMALARRTVCILCEREVQGVTILSLRHDFADGGECPLKNRVDRLVSEGRIRILINLEQMGDADSSDIGRLIRAHLSLRRVGGRIHLCGVLPGVTSLLAMTRLDTVFEVHQSEAEGIQALRASSDLRFSADSFGEGG